ESGQPPAQGEPPVGFVCSFMRALLHVLDRGREFSVASPLSTLLPMASQPSEMSSCNWMMRTCRFVLGRADGSGRSDCGTLAGKLVDASPVGPLIKIGAIPMVVTGTHNPYLVALSILVAAFASYTALDLGGHLATARGLLRRVWVVAAAITMRG